MHKKLQDFRSSTEENLITAAVHRWYGFYDQLGTPAENMRPQLAEHFQLELTSGTVETFDQFKSFWEKTVNGMIKTASHHIESIELDLTDSKQWIANVKFWAQLVLKENNQMLVKNYVSRLGFEPGNDLLKLNYYSVKEL